MPIKMQKLTVVTSEQMREIDRLMTEEYGILLIQMMENAGRNLAETARCLLNYSVAGKKIAIAVGKGNNGGGGMVAARHLSNWGARVTVLSEDSRFSNIPELQWKILQKLPVQFISGLAAVNQISSGKFDLFVDALIGYGLKGSPRGYIRKLINKMNDSKIPILSLDLPSGLDATTGEIASHCIRAVATMTLALPKTGLLKKNAQPVVGKLFLADIGVPPALYRKMGLFANPIFGTESVIELPDLHAGGSSFMFIQPPRHKQKVHHTGRRDGSSCIVLESQD